MDFERMCNWKYHWEYSLKNSSIIRKLQINKVMHAHNYQFTNISGGMFSCMAVTLIFLHSSLFVKKKAVSIGEWDSNPRPLGGGFIILVQWPPMPLFLDTGSLIITFKHRILGYHVQWSSGQNFIVKRKSWIALCHIWINIKNYSLKEKKLPK